MSMLIDTHCHVQFKAFDDDRDAVLARCKEKGTTLNVVGTQKRTSELAVQLAEAHENIYASIGLHPIQEYKTKVIEEDTEFVSRGEAFDDAYYDALAASPKVIAVGETGLDRFHVPKDEKTEDVMDTQKRIFLQHYRLAQKHNLPLVIHVRDAHNDMIELLKTLDAPIKGVIHCYTGNWTYAKEYLDLGLYLGFTGVITFPPKKTDPQHQIDLLNVLEHIPLDRMVVETDSPYLAPQAYRGKRAEPWMVEETVKKIAEIRGMKESDLAGHVAKNTKQLFQKMK